MVNKPAALALLGPTASGKTQLSLTLATQFPLEIISVDSALVYRRMDIGTAKPTAQELEKVPHHLIDVIEPWQRYSAATFAREAKNLIEQINQRGNIALLVGGTMLYYKALSEGLSDIPATEPNLRAALDEEFEQRGFAVMQKDLAKVDPRWAAHIADNDRQRLLRGLAVYRQTGRSISSYHQQPNRDFPAMDIPACALMVEPRALLHDRIAQRFSQMLELGFVEEVRALVAEPGFDIESPAMRVVGYRQCLNYLHGVDSMADFVDKANAATRQLAKRQITWLRSLKAVECMSDPEQMQKTLALKLEKLL